MKDFLLGCNYWASDSALNMWKDFNVDVIEKDFKFLKENGIDTIRIFPLWRDFQPIRDVTMYGNIFNHIRLGEDKLPFTELGQNGIDEEMMKKFGIVLDLAEKYGFRVIACILAGWMSARIFVPEALCHSDLVKDAKARLWEVRFVKSFVKYFKNRKCIIAWEGGNECNCLSNELNYDTDEATAWTALITDAIRSVDNTRPIYSGMTNLTSTRKWSIQGQAEFCDVMTIHPYPISTPYAAMEGVNSMRSTLHAVAEGKHLSGVSRKPCLVEEIGILGNSVCSDKYADLYGYRAMLSSYAYNLTGFLWWCAFDQDNDKLNFFPYDTVACERDLGLAYDNENPKPIFKKYAIFKDFVSRLNIDSLPKLKTDAVCILHGKYEWESVYATTVLSVQAGINVDYTFCEQELKDSDFYILPNAGALDKYLETALIEKIKNGATLYTSYGEWCIPNIEKTFGVRVKEHQNRATTAKINLGGEDLSIERIETLKLELAGAKLLQGSQDDIVLTEYRLGKGKVYFLNAPFELAFIKDYECYKKPYYKLYEQIISKKQIIKKRDGEVGITTYDLDNGEILALLINYGDKGSADVELDKDYKIIDVPYGKIENNTAIFENYAVAVKLKKIK